MQFKILFDISLIITFITLVFDSQMFGFKMQCKTLFETRLTYNCAHLRSTKESLTDSVKNLFVRKNFCVKICLGENLLDEHFLS